MNTLLPARQRWLGALTLLLGALTLLLGSLALWQDDAFWGTLQGGPVQIASALLFRAAGLLVLDQSPSLPPTDLSGWARISALAFAATASLTIVLGISSSISRRVSLSRIRWGSWVSPAQAHAALIGLGPLALSLIRDIRAAGGHTSRAGGQKRSVIAVGEGDGEVDFAREAQSLGALVHPGEAHDPEVQGQLGLDLAREVFVTAKDDARALGIAGDLLRATSELGKDRSSIGALQCYVHVGDPTYAELFHEHPLFQAPRDTVDFHVFNDRELSARHLLLDEKRGLATAHAPDEDEIAHYVIVGFGAAGQTIATQAARLAHFSGLDRLRMTVVGDFRGRDGRPGPAAPALRSFLARYPAFAPEDLDLLAHARLSDPEKDKWSYRGPQEDYRPACKSVRRERPAIEYVVNAEFLDLPAEDPDLADQLCARFAAEGDRPVRPAIIVCFDDEGRSFRTALRLKELLSVRLREAAQKGEGLPPIPVFAFLPQEEGLAELISTPEGPSTSETSGPKTNGDGPGENVPTVSVHAAGMHSKAVGYRQVVRPVLSDLARSIARHYEEKYSTGEVEEDFWEKLSPAFKKSNEDAAAHAIVKLRTIGSVYPLFGGVRAVQSEPTSTTGTLPKSTRPTPKDPDVLGQMEHNRFVTERILGEWRHEPYPEGFDDWPKEKKDALRKKMKDRKRRASLCPFEDLPADDIPKDDEQVVALRDALGRMGIEVPRLTEWIRSRPYAGAEASGDSAPSSS